MGRGRTWTATIFVSTPMALAWIGGIPALEARSMDSARNPWMISGPALRFGHSETVKARSFFRPAGSSWSLVWRTATVSFVPGGGSPEGSFPAGSELAVVFTCGEQAARLRTVPVARARKDLRPTVLFIADFVSAFAAELVFAS
ncbi:hypothetical protein SMICM17S_11579 [Streptomyces microflavus]